jgi:hypothetical protein
VRVLVASYVLMGVLVENLAVPMLVGVDEIHREQQFGVGQHVGRRRIRYQVVILA